MIDMQLLSMCHDCPMFEAAQTTNQLFNDSTLYSVEHIITCQSMQKCLHIKDYILNNAEKGLTKKGVTKK
ncbi:MAG: hypothetical protein R3Y58_01980 [Eubacteriales bacterium]